MKRPGLAKAAAAVVVCVVTVTVKGLVLPGVTAMDPLESVHAAY